MRLKKISVPPMDKHSTGYHYYTTHDGRFTINKIWTAGWCWQAKAEDGSRPFRGFGGRQGSQYYNADTLADIRDELDLIYEVSHD